MIPDSFHDFFVASGGVAGALIGLLFVAVSVTQERMTEREDNVVYRLRASAALTSFSNALVVSLFALIPSTLGGAVITVGFTGLAFVGGAVLSLVRIRRPRWRDLRDLAFFLGLVAIFVIQLVCGFRLLHTHGEIKTGLVQTIAIVVVGSFLVGISRAWELIGGASISVVTEVGRQVGAEIHRRPNAADEHTGERRPEP